MREKILDYFYIFQSFIYKNQCVGCNQQLNFNICTNCFQKIIFNDYKPVKIYDGIAFYSVAKYEGPLRNAILSLKFKKNTSVTYDLTRLLCKYWKNLEISNKSHIVIPIPIHLNKIKKRGYNHMDLIGKQFAYLMRYNFNNKSLKRTKDTLSQYELTYEQRKINLDGAFSINKNIKNDYPILIVDDIFTTGATMQEAIKTFKSAGIKNITVLTLSDVDLVKFSQQKV